MIAINTNLKAQLHEEYTLIYHDDFSELFRHIRKTIKYYLNKTRPGIMLGLLELGFNHGNFIGGFHLGGTNEIYLNKSSLRILKQETDSEKYKAYIYFVLFHEYIHAIGYHNEDKTRRITKDLIIEIFGTNHVLGMLAIHGLAYFFPYTFSQRRYKPSSQELLNPEFVTLHHRERDYAYQ